MIDSNLFRNILSQFASGVTVVTTRNGDTLHGLTVSSFCSVSLEPPLILVCIDKKASSHDVLQASKRFAVNVLTAAQQDLSNRFADPRRSPKERFQGLAVRTAVTQSPILPDVLAYLDCEVYAEYDGGDHTIFVGKVVAGDVGEGMPLLYWNRGYREMKLD
ncbi:MAG: flavin reductase family protein [candidate division KSB1 bacterium]|nr:flavin reductase family protein [candidate division KSB1 bacterium]MDQ7064685.1 flavin reductase family protein [candidate division KSB1 bacterium]